MLCKPDALSSILATHNRRKEPIPQSCLLTSPCVPAHNYAHRTMSVSCCFRRNTATKATSRKKGLTWLTMRGGKSIIVGKSKQDLKQLVTSTDKSYLYLAPSILTQSKIPCPIMVFPQCEGLFCFYNITKITPHIHVHVTTSST